MISPNSAIVHSSLQRAVAPWLQELHEGPWSQRDLDGGANVIIPIPAPLGGAVVVGENVVAYFNEGGPPKVTPIQPTIVQVKQEPGRAV